MESVAKKRFVLTFFTHLHSHRGLHGVKLVHRHVHPDTATGDWIVHVNCRRLRCCVTCQHCGWSRHSCQQRGSGNKIVGLTRASARAVSMSALGVRAHAHALSCAVLKKHRLDVWYYCARSRERANGMSERALQQVSIDFAVATHPDIGCALSPRP